MLLKYSLSTTIYIIALLIIVSISFIYYAPCNYLYFNSDHAIHVLMAKNFQLPRDYFYWGQNRLGSLLPMFAFLLGKIIPLENLYLCTIVQYLFLFTGFIILSIPINHKVLKLALCALIFLPVNQYNALILIGHPYASQLFAGALFIYFLHLFRNHLLNSSGKNFFLKALCLSFLSSLFFTIGIWASELSFILILIPVYFYLIDTEIKQYIREHNKSVWFVLVQFVSLLFFLLGLYAYYRIKQLFHGDPEYDVFFVDFEGLKKNISFFIDKLNISLLYKDHFYLENSFNWFLVIITFISLTIWLVTDKKLKITNSILINSLFLVSGLSSLLLFLSAWNLRSEFCPRYFTPIYIVFCVALVYTYDRYRYKSAIQIFVGLFFIFFCMGFCYTVFVGKERKNPFEQYSEYKILPKGTLIADYWDTYLINAIAIDSLQSLPFDYQQVRNFDWKDQPLSEKNFYFLKSNNQLRDGLRDTIEQFDILFKYSGTTYNCQKTDVLLYHKIK